VCRLFGLHAGDVPVLATFWLLDAPDSLAAQSHRNPDGAGIGVFGPDGDVRVEKSPLAAWQDEQFARDARDWHGTTFLAHVRYASTGGHTVANTHPFLQDGRLFAHNGVVQGLELLDKRLAEIDVSDLVKGETDSERVFALITAEVRRRGDVAAGIVAGVAWIADNLPVYALNLVLTTATDLWALRYPETHELYLLARPSGGSAHGHDLDARSARINAQSAHLRSRPSLLVASEPMDDDPRWRLLDSGELVHVGPDLGIETTRPLPAQPRHLLTLAQLDPVAAASQHPRQR
jgi:predicted glutamine amidotransferase